MSDAFHEYLPAPSGVYDPLADEASASSSDPSGHPAQPAEGERAKASREPLLRFRSFEELAAYQEPPDHKLAGDYHLQRGGFTVLAGPPGCGKSRASLALALAGAAGSGKWLGLKIQSRFRTLILQNENGLARLHREVPKGLNLAELRDWIRISDPPVVGLAIHNPTFRAELKAAVRDFKPDLIVIDPFNATTRDSMEKDFAETLTRLREIQAEAGVNPACLILHHLRKPKSEDRHKGRSLTHLLAGSYVLVSVARAVLVIQPATDDTEDDRVIVTPAKNNDGELGPRTAWRRTSDGFEEVANFDWTAYDGGQATPDARVQEAHLRAVFKDGTLRLPLKMAAQALKEVAKVGRSTAYDALKLPGKFSHLLGKSLEDECLFLKASQDEFGDGSPG
ncbi:MAG: AAA family ATPase [Verrucomicrobiae bacterium]|nr:AAA family ATPase [Verrucomicrobiae bacterium]